MLGLFDGNHDIPRKGTDRLVLHTSPIHHHRADPGRFGKNLADVIAQRSKIDPEGL
jgi:hypothetical protein